MAKYGLFLGVLGWVLTASVTAAPAAGAPATSAPAAAAGSVGNIKVVPDKAPDCTSLKNIVDSVTRECKTNDEKFIALYNFMILSNYHRQYPEGGPPLKWFNCYGWSLCGGLASLQSSLYKEMGWGWRHVGWPGHNMAEAKYDGSWHWFDCFMKFYAWRPDAEAPGGRTIACQDDLAQDLPGLVTNALVLDPARNVVYAKNNRLGMVGDKVNWTAPALLTCGDGIEGIVATLPKRKIDGENADRWGKTTYSGEVNLRPGFALVNTWDAQPDCWWWPGSTEAPAHTCKNKDLRNDPSNGPVLEPYYQRVRSYSNGTLICNPDFSTEAVLQSFAAVDNVKFDNGGLVPAKADAPASVTVLLDSPFVIVKASGSAEGADAVTVEGSNKPIDLKDFTAAVKGKTTARVQVSFKTRLKALKIEAVVMNNSGALQFLSPGKNVVTVSVADAKSLGDNKLVVTYAYAPGYRNKSFEDLYAAGKNLFTQEAAVWAENPTVVRKVFAAKDLPAKFEIDVPTPKDKYAVYPRMLFLSREVIGANAKPMPLPDKAQDAKIGPTDELKTMPNPFLIGSQAPPPKRATKTVVLELQPGHFVTKSGELPTTDFVKWPKNPQDTLDPMAYLIGGELKGLPAMKDFAEARLVFPVLHTRPECKASVGVLSLKAPFEAGKKYDFDKLGEVLGTVIVPKQPEDRSNWDPPKEFKVDVSGLIRAVAANQAKFNGFALRILPNMSVDEGYPARIHLPAKPKIYLEVDTYVDTATPPK